MRLGVRQIPLVVCCAMAIFANPAQGRTPPDRSLVPALIERVANQKDAEAAFTLGEIADRYGPITYAGSGIEKFGASRWYQAAAELGHAGGLRVLQSRAPADAGAMLALGDLYRAGQSPLLRQDPVEAARLYRRAASMGDPGGHFKYAMLAVSGTGAPADERDACNHFWKAAASGYQDAYTHVVECANRMPDDYHTAALGYFRKQADSDLAAKIGWATLAAQGRAQPFRPDEAIQALKEVLASPPPHPDDRIFALASRRIAEIHARTGDEDGYAAYMKLAAASGDRSAAVELREHMRVRGVLPAPFSVLLGKMEPSPADERKIALWTSIVTFSFRPGYCGQPPAIEDSGRLGAAPLYIWAACVQDDIEKTWMAWSQIENLAAELGDDVPDELVPSIRGIREAVDARIARARSNLLNRGLD